MSNEINEKLFEQIFGHTLIKLADKLINTTNKRKSNNYNNINKNKDNIYEKYYFDDWVIELSDQRINLKDAIDLILDFNENEYENKYENEDEDDYYENENEYENENKDEDETMSQKIIKNLNDNLDEIIDKSKSFEDQIESLKKEDLKKYFPQKDYDDKELKYKYFKLKLADTSNEIDKKLFEKIFGHTLIKFGT